MKFQNLIDMETNKKTIPRDIDIINAEIIRLRELVIKRNDWLTKPENKMRSTYKAVLQDTQEIIEQIKELENELQLKL